jgi:O-antigen/teichoic acid export membrane protein
MQHQNTQITGKLLTRNWGLNLLGQILPLIVALVAMPFIVRGLGPERFGVLSIVWAVLGSLTLFDLGLARSTTKYVAECLGRGDLKNFPGLFWTSLWSQLLIGLIGTLLMAALVPHLVDRYLKLSPASIQETRNSFLILAAAFPIVLGGNSIRGVLEAVQRFDIVNYVRIPASISIFLFSAIALPLGLHLPAIVFLLVLSRLAAALIYLVVCARLFPSIRGNYSLDAGLLRTLLAYGGWVSISNFVAPLLGYADRFVIGAVLGMSSVSYYTAPNEAITKASLLPGTLLTTLFPALASLDASGARGRVQELCARAVKSLLLLMTPSLLVVFVFSRQILQLWLGSDFAMHSTVVLQIFCVGVWINALAFVPSFLLQGLGRPDVTAKIHMIELPIYAVALAVLLPRIGLTGAALAWSFRLTIDAFMLFGAASWLKLLSIRAVLDLSVRRAILLLGVLGAMLALPFVAGGRLPTQLLFVAAALLAFVVAVWKYVFDAKDKDLFLSTSLQIRAAMGRSK